MAFSARARHVDALRRVAVHLDIAIEQLAARQGELAGEELRLAQIEYPPNEPFEQRLRSVALEGGIRGATQN